MPNATVRAKARTLPEETPITRAEAAALQYEPLPAEDLEICKPPSNDEWLRRLPIMRIAYLLLGKSKEEMKDVARTWCNVEGRPDAFDALASTAAMLKGFGSGMRRDPVHFGLLRARPE
jgi:hypothetical protein